MQIGIERNGPEWDAEVAKMAAVGFEWDGTSFVNDEFVQIQFEGTSGNKLTDWFGDSEMVDADVLEVKNDTPFGVYEAGISQFGKDAWKK